MEGLFEKGETERARGNIMKRLRRVLLVTIVIISILCLAAKKYLTSRQLASQIASRLEAAYGGPVRVAGVDIGLRRSTLTSLQLFEDEKSACKEPWVTVDVVEADVSVLNWLRGNVTPESVTLTGAAVMLRFDKEGHLLTTLPAQQTSETGKEGALPNLRFEHSQITIQKEGAADLVIPDIKATLQSQGDQIVLAGHADNAHQSSWGPWNLQGVFGRQTKETSFTLRSDGAIHVTQAMLNELPFVQASVWQAVQVDGNTPISATIHYDGARQAVHYRIELEPRGTEVHVPCIDLDATGASGKVVVEDGLVELRDVQGQAFEGTIRTDADLDFQKALTRLEFSKVEVQGLNMRRLPVSWDLPRQIEGRLRGSAKLEVLVGEGKPKTRGEGQGQIDDARIGCQPASEPVHLELHAKEGGFGFGNPKRGANLPEEPEEEILGIHLASELILVNNGPLEVTPFAAPIVNDFCAGLTQAVQCFTLAGSRIVGWLSDHMITPQGKPGEPGRFVEVNVKMDSVDLALLVKGLGLKLPFAVGGLLSYQVQAFVPLDTSDDFKTYRVKGSAHVAQFRLANIELEELGGNMDYSDGVLRLQDVKARITGLPVPGKAAAAGSFQGAARLQLVPIGELTADMKLDQIPLSRLAGLAGATGRMDGGFSGTVVARVPADKLRVVNAWEAVAKITTQRLLVFGWTVQDGHGEVRLKQGLLSSADLHARLEGTEITGSGELRLANPYRYRGKIALRDWDLSSIQRLDPAVRPAVQIEGRFSTTADAQGTLQPLTLSTAGTGNADDVTVYAVKFKNIAYTWKSENDRVTLEKVRAHMYEGTVDGRAIIPLQPAVAGSVDLRTAEMDVGALAKALPALPFTMEGRAGGTLQGTLAAAAPDKERAVAWDLDLQAARLRIQGIPTEQLKATIGYRQGTVDYRVEGKTLGGRLNLDGQVPPTAAIPGKVSREGRLRVQRARLSGVSEIFHLRPELLPLRGLFDLDIKFRHEGPDRAPVGAGLAVVTRPRWGEMEVASLLQGEVLLTRQELRLRDITASLGEGVLHSQLAFNLRRLEQSWFTLSLEGVEASRALASWPNLAGKVEGPLEAHLRGRLGREWSGSGDLFLSRGKVMGADVADWRLPLTWNFAPAEGRGEVTCRETTARLATGRATGQATVHWGSGLRLDGQLRFFNVELRTLLRQGSESTPFGNGRVTGRFDFAATEAHSLNDLTGSLEATLTQNQAFQFPVLRQIAPFLGIQSSSTFESGELRARLARGAFRIQNLQLQRPSLQVSIEGNVALAGPLDLDVTAKTGLNAVDPTRLAGLRLPLPGAVPVLRLRVTGTARNPNIGMEPLRLLTR